MQEPPAQTPPTEAPLVEGESRVFLPALISAILIFGGGLLAYHFTFIYLPFGIMIALTMPGYVTLSVFIGCLIAAVICSIGAHTKLRKRISIALLVPPLLLLTGLAALVLFSAANTVDSSELTDATDREIFFAMVAVDTLSPQICEKISPQAGISASGGWFDRSQDYLRSKCYHGLAVLLEDASLCKNVKSLKVTGEVTGNYSESKCTENLSLGRARVYQNYQPYEIDDFASIMQELGYTKQDVYAYYDKYVGGPKPPNPSEENVYQDFYSSIIHGFNESLEERPLQQAKAQREEFIQKVTALLVTFPEQPSTLGQETSSPISKTSNATIDAPTSVYYTEYQDDHSKDTITVSILDGYTSVDSVTVFIIETNYMGNLAWDTVSNADKGVFGPLQTNIRFEGGVNSWWTNFIGYERPLLIGNSYSFKVAVYDSATHGLLKSNLITCASGSGCTVSDD